MRVLKALLLEYSLLFTFTTYYEITSLHTHEVRANLINVGRLRFRNRDKTKGQRVANTVVESAKERVLQSYTLVCGKQ